MIAIANSEMMRNLVCDGALIENLKVAPFENKYQEDVISISLVFTNHLWWSLRLPNKDQKYFDLIKYVKIYRNGIYLASTRRNVYYDDFATLTYEDKFEYRLEVISVTLDVLDVVTYFVSL
jgi:hypothetical protein